MGHSRLRNGLLSLSPVAMPLCVVRALAPGTIHRNGCLLNLFFCMFATDPVRVFVSDRKGIVMDGIAYFQRMFAYDSWAAKAAFESLRSMPGSHERPLSLLAHILGAQKMWHHRLTGMDTSALAVWPVVRESDIPAMIDECAGYWQSLLATLDAEQLDSALHYANTKGDPFVNSVRDIISHVVMHSVYHRSQIALLVKDAGGTPAVTDFIAYSRTQ